MLIGAVIASIGFGGGFYYLLRSGRLSIKGRVAKAAPVAAANTHLVALDPLLVNLADAGGSAYLRLSMTLQVEDDAPKKGRGGKGQQRWRRRDGRYSRYSVDGAWTARLRTTCWLRTAKNI